MKITYRITERDFMGAYDLFVKNEKPARRRISRRAMPWLGGLLIALQVLVLIIGADVNKAVVAFGFLLGAYFLYCGGFALRRFFRNAYRKDQRFQQEFTTEASDAGVHMESPTEDSHMKWQSFTRYLESEQSFLLFQADWIFNIIPKRAFAPGEADQFRDLLHRNVPADKH